MKEISLSKINKQAKKRFVCTTETKKTMNVENQF